MEVRDTKPDGRPSRRRRRRGRRRRRQPFRRPSRETLQRGIYILPNLFTTGGMACGFYSVVQSIQGDLVFAAWLIMAAGIFDLVDGRVARLTHTTSLFGMQYDSLADLASFGVAPAILMYRWGLEEFGWVGWIAAFLFFVCGALRLARFNVQQDMGQISGRYFTGLPIPFAAFVAASTVIFAGYLHAEAARAVSGLIVLGLVFSLAFLMVSTVRFRSFKDFNLRAQRSFQALVTMVLIVLLVLTNPEVMLFVCAATYVFAGITSELWRQYRRLTRAEEQPTEAENSGPAGP